MRNRRGGIYLAWSLAFFCITCICFGKENGNGGGSNKSGVKPTTVPTVNTKAVVDSLAKYNAARAKSSRDEDVLLKLVDKLRAANAGSPDYKAALAEQQAAHAAYLAVVQPLEDAEIAKPEYKAALADKTNNEALVKKLRDDPSATPEQLTAAATAVLGDGTHISQLQAEAIANNQAVNEANSRQTAADAKIAQLDKDFDASIRTNPDWIAARKLVDDDKTAEAAAEQTYEAAVAAANQEAAARAAAIKQNQKNAQLAKDGVKVMTPPTTPND